MKAENRFFGRELALSSKLIFYKSSGFSHLFMVSRTQLLPEFLELPEITLLPVRNVSDTVSHLFCFSLLDSFVFSTNLHPRPRGRRDHRFGMIKESNRAAIVALLTHPLPEEIVAAHQQRIQTTKVRLD